MPHAEAGDFGPHAEAGDFGAHAEAGDFGPQVEAARKAERKTTRRDIIVKFSYLGSISARNSSDMGVGPQWLMH